jgi:hypothetical protein
MRTQVHTCAACSAVFEGPWPTQKCPGCHQPASWKTIDVDRQPGVVGGRAFVPGTQTPMTRIFYCQACGAMQVTRDGSLPGKCLKCGTMQAFVEATPNPNLAMDHTPKKSPADELLEQALRLKKEEQDKKTREEPYRQMEADSTLGSSPAEQEIFRKFDREPQTDEQYRKDWIAERAIESWSRMGLEPVLGIAENIWIAAERFYDEGRKRGFLP